LQKTNLYIIIFFFTPFASLAQELSYIHYDTKDGLAGSTVYDMCQDKVGFLWFATETGLSRYDGKEFKNFTIKDGLPDNEVLRVYTDSRGRVWIMTFKKAVAYYYQNKIYTDENNRMLSQIGPESNIVEIDEDEEQNIMMSDGKKIVFIDGKNSVKQVFPASIYSQQKEILISIRKNYFGEGFIVRINDSIFSYKYNTLKFINIDPPIYDRKLIQLITRENGTKYFLRIPQEYINYQTCQNYVKYINTSNGCFVTDTVNKIISEHYLAGKKVSRAIEDSEGNLWFATLGEGIYKLSSKEIKTLNFRLHKEIPNPEVFSIDKYGNNLLCGLGFSKTALINKYKLAKIFNFQKHTRSSKNSTTTNRLYCIKTLSPGISLLGFDSYLIKLTGNTPIINKNIYPIKSIDIINKDFLIVGTSNYAFKIRVKGLEIIDTIWKGRCTKVFYEQNKYYIATLNGLYEVNEDRSYTYLGDHHPKLKGRIYDIKSGSDHTLYIATADKGIVVYKSGKIVSTITERDGLSSNICRTLFLYDNFLLIGTNKGLNKIDINRKDYPILKYSTSDGMPSDIINAIYAEDSIIWIGSPAGLTYFNENKISSKSACNIELLNIFVSGKEQQLYNEYRLSYNDNDITLEYAGISFRSGGDIEYFYKLIGLDKKWNKTNQNSLIYKSLPSGSYEFHLYAINKFGLKSNLIKVRIIVTAPFWKKWWFYGVSFLFAIALSTWIVNKKIMHFHASRHEKNRIQQQFAALEQQALQAQMNPHFIFNCLNSIQQYILTNDKEKANQYLTGFASLVRQTLENSEKRTITLTEEINYLNKYLQMEEMRFAHNFSYEIIVDKAINTNFTEIPALLLQPYIENCLRHGIRYRENGTGKVNISFSIRDNSLYCSIKDNGVGRKKATEFKSKQHIEHRSRGMKLTEKRIELLNKINKSCIAIEIIDLKYGNDHAIGTEVIIKIPLKNYE
jgi:ligand-binding sensor domain-containing protein